jgi:hypothetical protein
MNQNKVLLHLMVQDLYKFEFVGLQIVHKQRDKKLDSMHPNRQLLHKFEIELHRLQQDKLFLH